MQSHIFLQPQPVSSTELSLLKSYRKYGQPGPTLLKITATRLSISDIVQERFICLSVVCLAALKIIHPLRQSLSKGGPRTTGGMRTVA